MNQKLAFSLLALLVPAAGCGNMTAEPIGSGASSSSSSASSGGTGGGTGTTTGSGGSGECAPACGTGEVCVESACHALVELAQGGGTNCNIVLDATTVYWAGGQVQLVPKSGGAATALSAWVANPALAVDDTYLYFNGNGGLERAEKSGKSGFSNFAGEGSGLATHMVTDGSTLYYTEAATDTNPPSIYETPTTGPGVDPTMVLAPDGYGIGTLAVDATSVYFWGGQGLVKVDKTTQASTLLAGGAGGFGVNVGDTSGIVVDGADVYYSSSPEPGSGAIVAKVSGAGGTSTTVVDAESGLSGVFAVDATSIWYMTVSGVMKVAKTGGAPVSVAALNPPTPFATCMAVDDTYVYWIDGDSLMQYKK